MSCEECVNWPPSAMGNKPCCFCYPGTPMNYFQRKEEQKDMVNTEFTEKAKKLVREYTADHLDRSTPLITWTKRTKRRPLRCSWYGTPTFSGTRRRFSRRRCRMVCITRSHTTRRRTRSIWTPTRSSRISASPSEMRKKARRETGGQRRMTGVNERDGRTHVPWRSG